MKEKALLFYQSRHAINIYRIAELKLLQSEGVMKAPKLSSIVKILELEQICMI
jgi:hypothetical protein